MKDLAFLKTLFAAALCGLGVTFGLVVFDYQGGSAWLVAGIMVISGIGVAAIPIPRRRTR